MSVRVPPRSTPSTATTATRAAKAAQIGSPWMYSFAQSEVLRSLFDAALESIDCGALVLPDGSSVFVKPSSPVDLATLPQAVQTCRQYLRVGDGDFALLNDPQSGGTTLSSLTLVTGARLENFEDSDGCDLLIASRLSFGCSWGNEGKLDEEGVRIPPTPLGAKGELNQDLLRAIASHPLAPANLEAAVSKEAAKLLDVVRSLKNVARDPSSPLRKHSLKRYLVDSSLAFEALMARLPLGSTIVTSQLASGETLKLTLNAGESRIEFNFAGSDASTRVGLTEVATLSACVATVLAYFNQQTGHSIPVTSAVFERFHVSAPSKTLLASRGNSGTFRGMSFAAAGVCQLVRQALAKLNTSFRSAKGADNDAHFSLRFANGAKLAGSLPCGSGATSDREGVSGFSLWGGSRERTFSVEACEANAPVVVTAAGLRAGTGGKGRLKGGDGSLLAFEMLEAAEVQWSLGAQSSKQEGFDSGRSGSPATLEVVRKDGSREALEGVEGSASLAVGEELRLYGAGGGAYGEPVEVAPET